MGLLILRSSVVESPPAASITGLDWDGTAVDGTEQRALYWPASSYTLPNPYDATYMLKASIGACPAADNRFHMLLLRGNSGAFNFGGDYGSGYYLITPYPTPNRSSNAKLSIGGGQNFGTTTDRVTRDNSSDPSNDKAADAPYITYDQWLSLALTARDASTHYEHKAYCDLEAGVTSAHTITSDRLSDWNSPPNDAILIGQSGTDGGGAGSSWGGEPRYEETNAIVRGIQIYSSLLTTTQLQARSACETDAEVLALNTTDGITSLWYLNMNPTVADVTDKSGNGHHGLWLGSARPDDWTEA